MKRINPKEAPAMFKAAGLRPVRKPGSGRYYYGADGACIVGALGFAVRGITARQLAPERRGDYVPSTGAIENGYHGLYLDGLVRGWDGFGPGQEQSEMHRAGYEDGLAAAEACFPTLFTYPLQGPTENKEEGK